MNVVVLCNSGCLSTSRHITPVADQKSHGIRQSSRTDIIHLNEPYIVNISQISFFFK